MIIPVRCFSCNKVLGNKWHTYCKLVSLETEKQNKLEAVSPHKPYHKASPKKIALDLLRIRRQCCRVVFICHFELPNPVQPVQHTSFVKKKKRQRVANLDDESSPSAPKRFRQRAR